MDPCERLTCQELLAHEYFDKKFLDMEDARRTEEHRRRGEKKAKELRDQQKSRTTVSTPHSEDNIVGSHYQI